MYKRMHFTGYQADGSVFRSHRLSAIVVAAIIGLAGFRGVIAAEPPAAPVKPIGAAGLATPQPPAQLRGVMRINPSKFRARAAVNLALLVPGIQAACSAVDPTRFGQVLRTIQGKEESCIAASYSAEDQRAAGCGATDTVDACQTKLYNFCMDRGGDRAAFRAAADQELALVTTARDKLDAQRQYIQNTRALHSGESSRGSSGNSSPNNSNQGVGVFDGIHLRDCLFIPGRAPDCPPRQ